MNDRDPVLPPTDHELAAPSREAPAANAASTLTRRLPPKLDGPIPDVVGVLDSPGDIEYASWIALLRRRSA